MDRKIHILYCRMALFRILIGNYLEAEALLVEVEMMPADISEVFTSCDTEGERTNATMNEVAEEMRRRKEQTAA
ncbi:hypothetical protein ZIOFF_015684 [Zingiber officinale]|uniref:Uncharacterized protein n=1 Tax=Zingiber officinale TaxID=94328 RepID=A0A8J5LFI0_ZINOF|nr:hypothetical protein ZIOFF_015684 [Zingiber officinale]